MENPSFGFKKALKLPLRSLWRKTHENFGFFVSRFVMPVYQVRP
jgi:hypothetical protein